MPKIEDYAFLSDTQSGALISREGSIDWLCLPRFDSGACFAALLGDRQNGRWVFSPTAEVRSISRRYRDDSLVLETDVTTDSGAVRLIDFMPPRGTNPDVVRIVEGLGGEVEMTMELIVRFDYGHVIPWVRKADGGIEAIAGPDALILRTPIKTRGKDLTTVAAFTVRKGERIPFVLTWFASNQEPPRAVDPEHALRETMEYWQEWGGHCHRKTDWDEAVVRSLVTLKGLTYAPTGGIVAAATTSLPEEIGGVRNWDYRYCWLRDATFTLVVLMQAGYVEEAKSWREWLLRAIAGSAKQMQIMYGVRGERRLPEFELPWLKGYENSAPVRIGNAASTQFQLDVYGEVLGAMFRAHQAGIRNRKTDWNVQLQLVRFLETNWDQPDEGIWEVRGGRKQFTHSKMMAWVAFDRALKLVEACNNASAEDVLRWTRIREQIHSEVCQYGYDSRKKSFTQYYGSDALDASLLLMPIVGFLPPNDKRIVGTVDAVQRELMHHGFVQRYRPQEENVDGLPGGEGVFLPCSFWLSRCLHLIGRKEEARALFERLLTVRNDLGLLSEEYDPVNRRQLGNFPQAFSHVSLVGTAMTLAEQNIPAPIRNLWRSRKRAAESGPRW
jgi:GH15 family glucan-1,4-alpha-glucosidase